MTYPRTAGIRLLARLTALMAALTLPAHSQAADNDTCTVNQQIWPLCVNDHDGWGVERGNYCIARSFCTSMPPAATRSAPVDNNANAKTRALFSYLRSVWGKQVIAGQADLTWKDAIDMAERVRADTGKSPALMGYDFMNYGLTANWVEGRRKTEEAIAFAGKGGLVTFAWHWRDPALLKTAQVNNANFYARESDASKNTNFMIPMARGALDKSSPAYQQINDGIDMVAVELKKLSDAGVTVLWRALHEASGYKGDGWFWWGRTRTDGVPQAYANILLWRHMFDRLVHRHGLHNLIWIWNGQDPAWYPGDDVVDIVSYDIYDGSDNKTYGSQLATYQQALNTPVERKPAALSENSFIPDPDKIAADKAWWLWFMVWNDGDGPAGVTSPNNFWTGEYYNTNAHKRKVYSHPDVITLDKLPRF
ncbi:glycosyl hydrolase [Massilia pseudoviolaceinigra]|uniref:glycosyl hydrolase n=1 Tax=Massilia pseudoviolaceinigra TaxID=3057165 RepID=UPI0027967A19|nr:glycosyl hydrolase [Massilia sp. CCM 9206]MDQ1921546.1 glycosyl hydrolase [Massilia sp. CCM 9206]